MKAPRFDYVRPGSLQEAIAALDIADGEARVLAGGQSLMPMLNMRLATPDRLVDINRLSDLARIERQDGSLRVGALVRQADALASQAVAQHVPLIARALPHVAHPAIRNRGTVGGSCAHADPAAELPACALALGARFTAAGRAGERSIAAEEFYKGLYATALAPGEILLAVDFPVAAPDSRCALVEITRRHGDYATVGLAAHARVMDGAFSQTRLVFFSVADRPILARAAGAALEGKPLSQATIRAAQDALDEDLKEIVGDLHTSAETKRYLARVLCARALSEMQGEASR